jgi:hypothetical protein
MDKAAEGMAKEGLKKAGDTLKGWNNAHTPTADFVNSACETLHALADRGIAGAMRPAAKTAVHGADTFGFFEDAKKSMSNSMSQAAGNYTQNFKTDSFAMGANFLMGSATSGFNLFQQQPGVSPMAKFGKF